MPSLIATNSAIGTRDTSGDGTAVIAAPGATSRIIIDSIQIQSESSTAVTVLVKRGSTTIDRVRCGGDAQGKLEVLQYPIVCGYDEAIYVNLSGAVTVNYVIRYRVQTA